MVGNYEKAVKKFIKFADWLQETDEPMIIHLKVLAKTLDKQVEATGEVVGAHAKDFGVTWGRLAKQKPRATDDDIDVDEDLNFS